jgi:hypothetical protein
MGLITAVTTLIPLPLSGVMNQFGLATRRLRTILCLPNFVILILILLLREKEEKKTPAFNNYVPL